MTVEIGVYEKVKFPTAREMTASFPCRALQLGVPNQGNIDRFERFIDERLAPFGVTHLLFCLDYNFAYKTHPEIAEPNGTTYEIASRVAKKCAEYAMEVVPAVNVLAHQSTIFQGWKPVGMLRAYPDMEETHGEELHSTKCVCSRHPRLRPIAYDMAGELMEAFGSTTIHTGFDEVWDIGKCPRCKGVAPELLFSQYVNDLNRAIRRMGGAMWMWGDQLVDGRLVPSMNPGYETCLSSLHKAVDTIDPDIVICDWHYYTEPYGQLAPSYWSRKPFRVIECAFNSLEGIDQLLIATRVVQSEKTLGVMLCTWSGLDKFMDEMDKAYPTYMDTGKVFEDKSIEDSGIANAGNFPKQAAASFLKMFVPQP
jgi:hypothetical protein